MKLVVKLRKIAFAIAYIAGPRLRLEEIECCTDLELDIALLRLSIHYTIKYQVL
jgi:hypothetical protein